MVLELAMAMMFQQTPAPTPAPAPAPAAHEYTDVRKINVTEIYNKYIAEHQVSDAQKKDLKELFQFRDFVGKSLDGRMVNVTQPKEKNYKPAKVLILSYIADWCPNCKYEAPYLRDLYNKYNSRGLEIAARAEYSEVDKMKAVIERDKTPYPVIMGSVIQYSDRQQIRMETFQYLLRSTLDDKRTWGTPFSIIIINGDRENPYVVTGEMKAAQIDPIVEKALGINP